MAQPTTIERLAKLTGDTTDQVRAQLETFHSSKAKNVLKGAMLFKIEALHLKLEKSKEWDEIKELQGRIGGLKEAIAALETGRDEK